VRLAGLVDDILSYHRLTGRDEGAKPQLSAFDIGWLCRECCEGFQVRSGRDGESPAVILPDGLPPVVADEGMIRRVLANLLDNAGRHAGTGARIWVDVERTDGEVRVSVHDDGKGMASGAWIAPEDPFVGPGSGGAGLGLGLSIVSRLLAGHGTELELSSEEGRGTTASFVLPLGPAGMATEPPAERPAPVPEPDPAPGGGPAGRTILVIEDDEDTADFVELALSSEGYQVAKAGSAEAALDRLAGGTVDLMLVDFTLPGMSGVEFCRQVKAESATSKIPLYMFTARAEPARRAEATEAGCDGYLVKPISVNNLLARVEEALSAAD
jgi:CheY-like chemotaxis protein